jgi:hypothetical protein
VRDWDPIPYPDPRRNRGELTTAEGVGAQQIALPVPKIWHVQLRTPSPGVAQLRTQVSPKYTGPAILKWIRYLHGPGSSTTAIGNIQVRVSDDDSGEGAVAHLAAAPSGESIFDTDFTILGSVTEPYKNALYLDEQGLQTIPHDFPLNYLIQKPEFFLKCSWNNPGSQVGIVSVVISLYTNVPQELIPELL